MIDLFKTTKRFLLVLVIVSLGLTTNGCERLEVDKPASVQYPVSVWECAPIYHPDSIIILTIDSMINKAYVSSPILPQDYYYGFYCMFRDEDTLILWEDKMLYTLPDSSNYYYEGDGYLVTLLSNDSMKLKYLGFVYADPMYVKDYLFIRKTN